MTVTADIRKVTTTVDTTYEYMESIDRETEEGYHYLARGNWKNLRADETRTNGEEIPEEEQVINYLRNILKFEDPLSDVGFLQLRQTVVTTTVVTDGEEQDDEFFTENTVTTHRKVIFTWKRTEEQYEAHKVAKVESEARHQKWVAEYEAEKRANQSRFSQVSESVKSLPWWSRLSKR